MNHIQMVSQILLVGMLERLAGKDDVLATIPCIVDQPGKSLEPGLAVLICQRNPPVHLLDVRRRVVVVGIVELPVRVLSLKPCQRSSLPEPVTPIKTTTIHSTPFLLPSRRYSQRNR